MKCFNLKYRLNTLSHKLFQGVLILRNYECSQKLVINSWQLEHEGAFRKNSLEQNQII